MGDQASVQWLYEKLTVSIHQRVHRDGKVENNAFLIIDNAPRCPSSVEIMEIISQWSLMPPSIMSHCSP